MVLGTQFAGGVFLGTAMMHFLSDSNETFGELTSKPYPFAFMLACAGYLITMLADYVISHVYGKNGNGGGGSHGGGDVEIQGLCFVVDFIWPDFLVLMFCSSLTPSVCVVLRVLSRVVLYGRPC